MPACTIVEIEVTDPVGSKNIRNGRPRQWSGTAENILSEEPRAKRWKAIGNRSELLFYNLIIWNAPRPGLIHRNTLNHGSSVIAPRRRE